MLFRSADNYVVTAQKGVYADLTDLYKKEGKELYKALDPAYIKGNTVNGKIYVHHHKTLPSTDLFWKNMELTFQT